MRRRSRNPRREAFTLVEVLAALTLMAIILPVAMRGFTVALSVSSDARRSVEAAALAETKLGELVVTGDWQSADLSGDWGTDWPDYRWEAEVEDWDVAGLTALTVRVTWERKGSERVVGLTTLVESEGE